LSGGCFAGAVLVEARLGASVNLDKAVFCNTVMPDGSVDDSGCGKTTACCPPVERDCANGRPACYTDRGGTCGDFLGYATDGDIGYCGNGFCCGPCGHPDKEHWRTACNQKFPDCEGRGFATDPVTFSCLDGCLV
jgi:hypothetical protein